MPPADSNTPPVPTPQEPKKGFFAKLFGLGKKSSDKDSVVPVVHESQTPPPQLDDTQSPASPGEGAMMGDMSVSPTPEPVVPDVSASVAPAVPAVEPDTSEVASVDVTPSTDETPAVSEESTDEEKPPVVGPTSSV